MHTNAETVMTRLGCDEHATGTHGGPGDAGFDDGHRGFRIAAACNVVQPGATPCNTFAPRAKRTHRGPNVPVGSAARTTSPRGGYDPHGEPYAPLRATPCNAMQRGATPCNSFRDREKRTHREISRRDPTRSDACRSVHRGREKPTLQPAKMEKRTRFRLNFWPGSGIWEFTGVSP
jgi:hypothetical protein